MPAIFIVAFPRLNLIEEKLLITAGYLIGRDHVTTGETVFHALGPPALGSSPKTQI